MKGQLELFPKKKKLIYSRSLSCYKFVCPYCRADNPNKTRRNICDFCGQEFDDVNLEIKTSKDLAECEALGLTGAVRKNEKGQWEEAK